MGKIELMRKIDLWYKILEYCSRYVTENKITLETFGKTPRITGESTNGSDKKLIKKCQGND